MRIIGVTGGIASGKNLVSFYLKQLGYPIFDADAVVHKLYKNDRTLISKIKNVFPQAISRYHVDRKQLTKYLIDSPDNWGILESIVHPLVMQKLKKFISLSRRMRCQNVVINMALLFTVKADKLCHLIFLVKSENGVRLRRIHKRENYNQGLVKNILAKQKNNDKKKNVYVIKTGLEKHLILQQIITKTQYPLFSY